MKNKKIIIAIIALAIVAACAVGIFKLGGNTQEESTTSTTQEVQETTETTQPSTEAPTQESTTQETTQSPMADVMGKYYYVFDDNAVNCYVLNFTDEKNVDIAFFDEENIFEGDPKHYNGFAQYENSDSKIVIKNLKAPLPNDSIELEIKDGKLYFDGKELICEKELSLNTVNAHFV